MKIELNKQQCGFINFDQIVVRFSFLHGRRLSINSNTGSKITNVSLNSLIRAVIKSAKQDHDSKEINRFVKDLRDFENKYYGSHGFIHKENFLIRIATKIKHLFACILRYFLVKKLENITISSNKSSLKTEKSNNQNSVKQIVKNTPLIELEKTVEPEEPLIGPFPLEKLPSEMQNEIISRLDSKSSLRFSLVSKQLNEFVLKHQPEKIANAKNIIKWKEQFGSHFRILDPQNEVKANLVEGLNFEIICKNEGCELYDKSALFPIGLNNNINVGLKAGRCKCQGCNGLKLPFVISMIIYSCQFKIEASKASGDFLTKSFSLENGEKLRLGFTAHAGISLETHKLA